MARPLMSDALLASIYRWAAAVLVSGGVCVAGAYLVHPDSA